MSHRYGIVAGLFLFIGCTLESPTDRLPSRARDLLSLHTVEYVYRMIVYYENTERFLGIIPTESQELLFSINAVIQAGVDLSEELDYTLVNRTHVTVTLPPPQILSVDLDESSIMQYHIRESGKRIDWAKVSVELDESTQQATQKAIARNILEEARKNAETQVRSVFLLLGFTDVRFTPPPTIQG